MGPLIVISGPSASGKSTIIERILAMKKWPVRLSVSVTTRAQRENEKDGVHYHFWSKNAFLEEAAKDSFLEYAEVFGHYYGTLKREVDQYRQQGMGVILDIDVQGWQQVCQRSVQVVSLFVRTSSIAVLRERLRERGTETDESLERRVAGAAAEIAKAAEYDYQIINDNLDRAVNQTQTIMDGIFERNKHVG